MRLGALEPACRLTGPQNGSYGFGAPSPIMAKRPERLPSS